MKDEQYGEIQVLMPASMLKAKVKGVFNSVQTGEKRMVLSPKRKILYTRLTSDGQETFTATSATLGAQCVLSRETTLPVTDELRQWWFNIKGAAGCWRRIWQRSDSTIF
ncbi:hypothetical protein AB9X52_18525 [Enterobacter hormaechei]|uniref:hypothetical protein n=1 Tax=Enterobacter hormaechei TaxID=158836 RepID=UPI00321DB12D